MRLIALMVLAHCVVARSDAAGFDLTIEPYVFEAQGQKIDADMGHITVPEDRSDPKSRTIRLAFVRFPSTAANPGPPIVYLAGGPGGSGIGTAKSERFHLFMALREVGDVIAFDQRGTGIPEPKLVCEERWSFPLDQPGDWDRWATAAEAAARACAEHFRSQGINLAAYNTKESAADVDALRQALGLEKISLWGTSYGTHLSLAVLRYHGEGINRAVLIGVEGPDHTLKLPSTIDRHVDKVHALFAADPEVSKAVPDFKRLLTKLLADLERGPIEVKLGSNTIVLGKFDLQMYTAEAVGRVNSIRDLPVMFYDLSRGDYRRLAGWSMVMRRQPLGLMMSWTMDCASGISEARRERIEHEASVSPLGNAINFPFMDLCGVWGAGDLGEEFRAPLHSDVPVLFVSGTLDGRTPPENAQEISEGFPNGQQLIVEGTGHEEELFSLAPGLKEAMIAFYAGRELPTTRITLPPIQFAPVRMKD